VFVLPVVSAVASFVLTVVPARTFGVVVVSALAFGVVVDDEHLVAGPDRGVGLADELTEGVLPVAHERNALGSDGYPTPGSRKGLHEPSAPLDTERKPAVDAVGDDPSRLREHLLWTAARRSPDRRSLIRREQRRSRAGTELVIGDRPQLLDSGGGHHLPIGGRR
jgi:hypothetical protein